MDKTYWKRAYQDKWAVSSERETHMIDWIREHTGLTAVPMGLGAGSDEFIPGSAADNGLDRGDADLHIADTDIYVEVTGPLSSRVSADRPLWFRPDKVKNAIKKAKIGHDTFFAHHCPSEDLWRVIHIDDEWIQRFSRGEFETIQCVIRGRTERYVQVPADDRCVRQLPFLKQYLIAHRGTV